MDTMRKEALEFIEAIEEMTKKSEKQKVDIYQEITDKIIAQLESGMIPWECPWVRLNDRGAYNRVTKKSYSMLNQMFLNKPGEYASYDQWNKAGAHVKKGSKASRVVFWKMTPIKEKDEATGEYIRDSKGKIMVKTIPLLKWSSVFHIDDVEMADGSAVKPVFDTPELPCGVSANSNAEDMLASYIERYNIGFIHSGDAAFYSPGQDSITLPPVEQFKSTAEYYSTAYHEAVHSTGHKSRLNRLTERAAFGSAVYSKEELVAEMGSAMALQTLGVGTDSSLRNSAAYIQNWLKALKDDKRLIVGAAGKAEKAVKMIFNIQDAKEEENNG